jgi:hypothetical protein
MRTIGYLGQPDALFGVPATTRRWSTVVAIAGILGADENVALGDGTASGNTARYR